MTISLRRLTAAAIAVVAVAAALAPVASADRISVSTSASIPPPYDQTALLTQHDIAGQSGPVLVNVRHRIECLRGSIHRRGYPRYCTWSSGLYGESAMVATQQGQGDVYSANSAAYPTGTTFHAGYMGEGRAVNDDWPIIVRHQNPGTPAKVFHMSVGWNKDTVVRTFTIR
jgi:hypothetical protein